MKVLEKACVAFGLLAASATQQASAQAWPTGTIRMVIPAGPGGTTDGVGRFISQWLSDRLGRPVVVDNRPGAGGTIGVTAVAKAPPDGYTLMIGTNTTMAANVFLYKNFNVDPLKDFVPLAVVVDIPFALVVPATSKFNKLGDLVSAAKLTPAKLNYGAGTSSAILCTELLKSIAQIDLVKISYKASPQALTDLMAGQLDVLCEPLASYLANPRDLRALALTGAVRSSLAPDLETVSEAGYPGMDYSAWIAFWAPAGLPKEIASRLSTEILAAMYDPEMRKKTAILGAEARPGDGNTLADMQRAEMEKISAVVQKANLVPE
jgi:tripartite-type tricarboxylate transporter receptor subunit TctC